MGKSVFVEDVPQQTLHVFLPDTLAGTGCGWEVQANVPAGLIDGQRPEAIGKIVILGDAAEQQQGEVRKDGVEVKIANQRQAPLGVGGDQTIGQAFDRLGYPVGRDPGRVHTVMVVQSDVQQAGEASVFEGARIGDGMPVLEGQVVQLVLGVERYLPVGFLVDAIGVGADELSEVRRAELSGNAAEIVAQALLRVGIQVDKMNPCQTSVATGVRPCSLLSRSKKFSSSATQVNRPVVS